MNRTIEKSVQYGYIMATVGILIMFSTAILAYYNLIPENYYLAGGLILLGLGIACSSPIYLLRSYS